jgi:hypothetical protein
MLCDKITKAGIVSYLSLDRSPTLDTVFGSQQGVNKYLLKSELINQHKTDHHNCNEYKNLKF